MDILTFINSLTNEDLNRIRNSKSDAEARRLLREYQNLQLQQTGVRTCFLEDYIDDLFGNEITYKQTSCCKIAPITNEKYCPNCGNKILK